MFDEGFLPPAAYPIILALAFGAAILIVLRVVRLITNVARRARPVKIHPRLQKYAEPTAAQRAESEKDAAKILTTSSRAEIPGYVTVKQIEAVFVDGFREPNEAILGLKAAAGRKGANAILNVTQERTANNKCLASGDAVIVRTASAPPDGDASP